MTSDGMFCCRFCYSRDVVQAYVSQRYGFKVGVCRYCGLIFVLDHVEERQLKLMYSDESGFQQFSDLSSNEKVRGRHRSAVAEIKRYANGFPPPVRLFDIGAGSGEFLNCARLAGFEVHGNEISNAAIRMARQLYGIELSPLPFGEKQQPSSFDVVTMWGLLEHLPNPRAMLQRTLEMLRPGGVLFAYTPGRCGYDHIALTIASISRSRWTRLLDRRITLAHLQMFTAKGMRRILELLGFEILHLKSVCEYNLPVKAYLECLGIRGTLQKAVAMTLDCCINKGLFFRNNLRILGRKPFTLT
jgi:2-polyprenyl-3-methyl-5-hydroxy-6-metoxy-1,4-benzoquinol methylase